MAVKSKRLGWTEVEKHVHNCGREKSRSGLLRIPKKK
jgi:hypothetical protein